MNTLLALLAVLATQGPPTATTTAATPELRERLLVYGLKADSVDDRIVKSIERAVVSTAVENGYETISTQDIAAFLELAATQQVAGCEGEASCMAEIADGLGANLVITGTVVRLDERRYELSLVLLEQNGTMVRSRALVDAESANALRDLAPETTRQLLGAIPLPPIDNTGAVMLMATGGTAVGLGAVGLVFGGLEYINARLNADYALEYATRYDEKHNADDLQKLKETNALYVQRQTAWNQWGWPVAAVGTGLVVAGAVAVVVGIVALE